MLSKTQRNIFSLALAYKKDGDSSKYENIKELADSMTEEQLQRYAEGYNDELPSSVRESIVNSIEKMSNSELEFIENETIDEKEKISDVPPAAKDNKEKIPDSIIPDNGSSIIKADKRKDPGFFTPSLFKRPGDTKVKKNQRVMDFDEFLVRINYRTHDGTTQYGHGSNLKGK